MGSGRPLRISSRVSPPPRLRRNIPSLGAVSSRSTASKVLLYCQCQCQVRSVHVGGRDTRHATHVVTWQVEISRTRKRSREKGERTLRWNGKVAWISKSGPVKSRSNLSQGLLGRSIVLTVLGRFSYIPDSLGFPPNDINEISSNPISLLALGAVGLLMTSLLPMQTYS